MPWPNYFDDLADNELPQPQQCRPTAPQTYLPREKFPTQYAPREERPHYSREPQNYVKESYHYAKEPHYYAKESHHYANESHHYAKEPHHYQREFFRRERHTKRDPSERIPLHKRLERPFPRNPSLIGDECSPPKERGKGVLLRPVFINAVEVGYAYGESIGKKGLLCMRGCTIALWYFILRGHDAKLFFPQCYRRYAEKTDNYNLLCLLNRRGLVQFTQGYGQEKYNELSRVLAANARRFGGCIVACSSLRKVIEENFIYQRIVQKRVLVPCFVGDEVLFPADGPEGRLGLPYSRTIVCLPEDDDYDATKGMQMKLEYQVRMLSDLRGLAPNGDFLIKTVEHFTRALQRIFYGPRPQRPHFRDHLMQPYY